MTTIAIYSMKGGVGKTSTSVNLAYNFAKLGYRTLLWDLDSQGASSFYFNVKPKVKNVKKLLTSKASLDEYIKGSDYSNLDIMPADFAYRNFDIMLDEAKKSKKRLKLSLEEVRNDYDIAILDSPPTISSLSNGIFYASDIILNPMVPTTLSTLTYKQLIEHLKDDLSNLDKLYAFFSMVDVRKALHKSTMVSFKDDERFLKQLVPYSSAIERMGIHRAPVGVFETNAIASRCYTDLAYEVIAKFALAPKRP